MAWLILTVVCPPSKEQRQVFTSIKYQDAVKELVISIIISSYFTHGLYH